MRRSCRLIIGRLGLRQVAFNARQRIAIEEQRDVFLLGQLPGLVHDVYIIPAIVTERVDQQRRAQQKAHLRTTEANFEACNAFLIDHVALLNVNPVGAEMET